jgi:hypothetical protein
MRAKIWVITITLAVATALVSICIARSDVLILSIGLLLLLSVFLVVKLENRLKKQIESMDKGKKLAEVVERPWMWIRRDVKIFIAGIGVFAFCIAIIILIEVFQGNSKIVIVLLPTIATIPAVITPNLVPRKRYIYEKGMSLGLRFIEWNEVTGYEWKNGLLEIRFKGMPKKIVVEDKEGEIKKIVEKYVNGG